MDRMHIEVNDMKKFGITLVLALVAMVCVSGCTTPETKTERDFRLSRQFEMDRRSFVDDSDYFWLINRSSSLTPWHKRVGY
ncbi:MAG: hypothetical protein HN350_11180 [Phycisphaerales bacterium]|nr:hypothetical protein [Phycisphaerales bacterium]